MRHAKSISTAVMSFLLCLIVTLYGHADQVIYVEVSDFDPNMSQFGVDVKGNMWVESQEDGAINGTAFGGPGNNDVAGRAGEPYLIFKLPEGIEAGESTGDRVWVAWARLYIPHMLVDGINSNSFFLRMSADAKNWTPQVRGERSLYWNDPMGDSFPGQFPANIPSDIAILTDIGERLPWVWTRSQGTGANTVPVVLAVGDNYAEVGVRESDPDDYPRIDVICFRNDGNVPSDAEAMDEVYKAVQSAGKSATTWGELKSAYNSLWE